MFFSYLVLLTAVLAIFAAYFYVYTSSILKERESLSIHQLSRNVSDQLDSQLKNLNAITERVLSSAPLKSLFFSNAEFPEPDAYDKWNIMDMLFSITGLPSSDQFYELNLFHTNGYFIKFGNDYSISFTDPPKITSVDWVRQTLLEDGRRNLVPPHQDDWNVNGPTVVSLARAFPEVLGSSLSGIVELQLEYNQFAYLIERSANLQNDAVSQTMTVYVYNSSGNLMYPYPVSDAETEEQASFFWEQALLSPFSGEALRLKNPSDGKTYILAFHRSDFSGCTVLLAESEYYLLAPVRAFRNNILSFGLIILIFSLFLAFFVAKGISNPIRKLRNSIARLNLQTIGSIEYSPASVNELEDLNMAYAQMCERLQSSLDAVVEAQSHELKAQLMALQAQMNPHFLYNTLATISIKAEINNQTDIMEMCDNLSGMLRYITTDGSRPVTLRDEVDYALKYLELMRIRYINQFQCSLDIPEEMNRIKVPKLIIQPLLENAFKHGFDIRPPWQLSVRGSMERGRWTICVTDNGVGFSEDDLRSFGEIIHDRSLPHMGISMQNSSVGLLNIYCRMRLLYGVDAVMEIANCSSGGARVILGGVISNSDL